MESDPRCDAARTVHAFGVSEQTLLNPESWHHDFALISRPGNNLVQLKLFIDYASDVRMYPQVQQYFRDSQVPLPGCMGSRRWRIRACRVPPRSVTIFRRTDHLLRRRQLLLGDRPE